jgi:hypothetical protein
LGFKLYFQINFFSRLISSSNLAGENALEGVDKEMAAQLAKFIEEKCAVKPEEASSKFLSWLYAFRAQYPEVVELADVVFSIAGIFIYLFIYLFI